MHIVLTHKANGYVRANERSMYPEYAFLGTVITNGYKCALAQNPTTGQYYAVNAAVGYNVELDINEVMRTLEHTKAPNMLDERGARRPANPMKVYQVSLDDQLAKAVMALGDGNMAAGIRMCCKLCTIAP